MRKTFDPGVQRGKFLAIVLLLCGAVLAAYLPSIPGPFVLDDFRNIVDNPSVQISRLDLPSLTAAAKQPPDLPQTRPLAYITFALNYYFGDMNPAPFRMTNVVILLLSVPLSAAVAFLLARAWLSSSLSAFIALGTTLLWTMNPLLTNGVSYIVQRMTSLNALFCLAALACFLMGARTARPWWHVGAALFWLLALGVKETALPLILVAFLYLWMTLPADKAARRWIGTGLLAGIVLSQAGIIALFHQNFARFDFDMTQRLLTEGRVVLRYLTLFLLPLPSRLNLDYDYALSQSLFTPPMTAVAIAIHLLLVFGSLALARRRPLAAFGLLSFYLLNVLESTVAPLEIIFEHRAYFPSFFLALGLVDLWAWGLEKLKVPQAGAALLAMTILTGAVWGALTYRRNMTWADPLVLWQDVVDKSPSGARGLTNLGVELNNAGRHREAVDVLRRSLTLNPNLVKTHHVLGNALISLGKHEEGFRIFEMGLAVKPDAHEILHDFGNALVSLGRHDEALRTFARSLAIEPDAPLVHNSMAVVNGMLGRYEEATRHFRKALKLKPDYNSARFNLGLTYVNGGNREKALAEYGILSRSDPALAARLLREINRRKN